MFEDPRAGRPGVDAYPQTDLLVGHRGLQSRCPFCDTVIYLTDHIHGCPECGASCDVDVRWSR